jgi:hypothetical protein
MNIGEPNRARSGYRAFASRSARESIAGRPLLTMMAEES